MFEFNFDNLFTAGGFIAIAAAIVKFIAIPAVREFFVPREKEHRKNSVETERRT